jgi:hypothetical protein
MMTIDSSIGAMPRGTMEGVKDIPGVQQRYEAPARDQDGGLF